MKDYPVEVREKSKMAIYDCSQTLMLDLLALRFQTTYHSSILSHFSNNQPSCVQPPSLECVVPTPTAASAFRSTPGVCSTNNSRPLATSPLSPQHAAPSEQRAPDALTSDPSGAPVVAWLQHGHAGPANRPQGQRWRLVDISLALPCRTTAL